MYVILYNKIKLNCFCGIINKHSHLYTYTHLHTLTQICISMYNVFMCLCHVYMYECMYTCMQVSIVIVLPV